MPSQTSRVVPAAPTGGARLRKPLLIIGCAVLVVALIATAAIALVNRGRAADQVAAADVSTAVRDYLSALSDGDAKRALGYLAEQPDDTSMMSAEVLQASNKIAPITDISVPEVTDPQTRSVSASYNVGDTEVQTMIDVRTVNDSILIDGGYFTLDADALPDGLPLRLNGTKITNDVLALFPGSYRVQAAVSGIGLGDGAEFAITSAGDSPVISIRPRLTDKGAQAFRQQLSAAISSCVGSTKIKAGCGLTVEPKLSGNRTVKEGTVQRKLAPAAEKSLQNLSAVLDPDKPTTVRPVGMHTAVQTTAQCEVPAKNKKKKSKKKTKTESCDLTGSGTSLGIPALDLTKKKNAISWS